MSIPFYRYLEVAGFSLLNLLPFLAIAIYAFRKHLRFSMGVSNLLVVIMMLLQIGIGYIIAFCAVGTETASLVATVIYAGFCILLVKDQPGRIGFILLILSNLGNLVSVCAKYIESLIFGQMALETYRWSLLVCMVIMHLVITVPTSFYVRKYFNSSVPVQTKSWNYIWIIPATFYAIWYQHLYFSGHEGLMVAMDWHQVLFLVVINAGAFVVYHMAILLLFEQQKSAQLEKDNYLMSLRTLQHDNLQQRINEARQAKHDVHHHVHLIQEYLRDGKLAELEKYLEQYAASLPDTQSLVYCQHYETNTLLSYFAQEAKKHYIKMDVFVQFPEFIRLPETTMSTVLGNLLENAIDASKEIPVGERKITVRGKYSGGFVFLEISNRYGGKLKKNGTGGFLSTKANGHGLGLHSVEHLVERYQGVFEVDAKSDTFRVTVMLQEQAGP